ncbi:MAG: hypothetical protein QOG99_635 [Frankiales bacterium]|nr:hypothetical protein [Frankiales bacterium]
MTAGWRWRSGAALSLVTSGSALLSFLSLRATSDGSAPAALLLLAAAAALALLLWPLAARSTRVLTLTTVLAAGQLGTHALTVLLSGNPEARGLVCCPASAQASPGPIGQLTAHAGWALVAVQLLACLVIAVLLRGARQVLDDSTTALRALFHAVRLLLHRASPVPSTHTPRAQPPAPLGSGRVVAGAHRLRGPPVRSRPGHFPVLAAG